jgi:hypothetical protein
MPVLGYYRAQSKVLELDGNRSPEEIRDDLFARLGEPVLVEPERS